MKSKKTPRGQSGERKRWTTIPVLLGLTSLGLLGLHHYRTRAAAASEAAGAGLSPKALKNEARRPDAKVPPNLLDTQLPRPTAGVPPSASSTAWSLPEANIYGEAPVHKTSSRYHPEALWGVRRHWERAVDVPSFGSQSSPSEPLHVGSEARSWSDRTHSDALQTSGSSDRATPQHGTDEEISLHSDLPGSALEDLGGGVGAHPTQLRPLGPNLNPEALYRIVREQQKRTPQTHSSTVEELRPGGLQMRKKMEKRRERMGLPAEVDD